MATQNDPVDSLPIIYGIQTRLQLGGVAHLDTPDQLTLNCKAPPRAKGGFIRQCWRSSPIAAQQLRCYAFALGVFALSFILRLVLQPILRLLLVAVRG
jgi:hypothetical protein